MKSLLILLLVVGLLGAAAFTRPTQASLRDYFIGAPPRVGPAYVLQTSVPHPMSGSEADALLDELAVTDCILWTSVRKGGQVQFTGVFGHWFPHAAARTPRGGAGFGLDQREQANGGVDHRSLAVRALRAVK